MTDEGHLAVRVGMRQAGDRMAALEAELHRTAMEFLKMGRTGGSSHHNENRALCVLAFTEASEKVVNAIITRKGERARNRRDELVVAMGHLQRRAQRAFDEHDSKPPLSAYLGIDRELETDLIARTHRILLDFDDGVYHMASDLSHRGGINIGSINQMAGHIGNNNQGAVRAQQSVNETDVLMALVNAITAQVVDADHRDRMIEAVQEMSRVKDDREALGPAYAGFISVAAAHMTIVAPFLPALAQMLA